MDIKFYIVDAFVVPEKAFSGNAAAVVLLDNDSDIDDGTKQNIAAELNQSVTAFVCKLPGSNQFLIRWFTPSKEIDLCGHATLATSWTLFNQQHQFSDKVCPDNPLMYHTKFAHYLEATFDGHYVSLNLPMNSPTDVISKDAHSWLIDLQQSVIGTSDTGTNVFVDTRLAPNRKLVLRLADNADIGQLKPDFSRMMRIDTGNLFDGVMVTRKADFARDGVHFLLRYFAPWIGINEDSATGSSSTVLTPYWRNIYKSVYKQELSALYSKQASQRTGFIRNEITTCQRRVQLFAKARLFCKGLLRI